MAEVDTNVISKPCVWTVIAAFFFQLTGFVSPGWIVIDREYPLLMTGVWYSVTCIGDAYSCQTTSIVGKTSGTFILLTYRTRLMVR